MDDCGHWRHAMKPAPVASVRVIEGHGRRAYWYVTNDDASGNMLVDVDCTTEDEARRVAALSALLHGAKLTNGKGVRHD